MSTTAEQHQWSPLTRMLLFSPVEKHPQPSSHWYEHVIRWMMQHRSRLLFIAVFTLIQTSIFAFLLTSHYTDSSLSGSRTDDEVYPSAKAAASLLNLNFAILILPLCQAMMTAIRRTFLGRFIPFEKAMLLHKMVATATLIFAWIHATTCWSSSAHHATQNGHGFTTFLRSSFGTWAGWSGWSGNITLILSTLILARTLWKPRPFEYHLPRVQKVLYLPIFFCWGIHTAFYAPSNSPSQSYHSVDVSELFWYLGAFIAIADLFLVAVRTWHRTSISKVVRHPNNVVEIQIKKDYTTVGAGQYILVCCPQLNIWKSCYLSLTSAPEEDYMSVHIHCSDPHTNKLANILGCKFTTRNKKDSVSTVIGLDRNPANFEVDPAIKRILPPLSVEGPYGGPGDHVFNNEIAILVGGGTGVIPFASILKSIWYRMTCPQEKILLRKVYFFCVLEDFTGYEWFRSLLMAIEAQDIDCNIEINTYLTNPIAMHGGRIAVPDDSDNPQCDITGLHEPTIFGRPNWDTMIQSISTLNARAKAGVFVSGPTSLEHQVHISTKLHIGTDFSCVWYGNDF